MYIASNLGFLLFSPLSLPLISYDLDGKGNGAFPDGLTMHDGKLVHNNVGDEARNIVGFNDQGKLVIGEMTAKEMEEKKMREAVAFGPNLIVEGEPVVKGNGGQGAAPLTGIGQMADGTDYHAVNAANLDGGSSSELVYNGKVMNRLWNIFLRKVTYFAVFEPSSEGAFGVYFPDLPGCISL